MAIGIEMTNVLLAPSDQLELVPVEVERVRPCVVIVQNDINDIALVELEAVRVLPVYSDVCGGWSGGQRRV